MVLEVHLQVLAGEHRGVAPVGAGHRHPAALDVVGPQRVGDELLGAVAAAQEALRAVAGFVLPQVAPLDLHAALVLAVHGLVAAAPDVVLRKWRELTGLTQLSRGYGKDIRYLHL